MMRNAVCATHGYSYKAMRNGDRPQEETCRAIHPGVHTFLSTSDSKDTWTADECQLILGMLRGLRDRSPMFVANPVTMEQRARNMFESEMDQLIEALDHAHQDRHSISISS